MPSTQGQPSWPTRTEARLLQLLAAGGEQYGLQLVKASGGWLKRGTVYVLLARMQDKGFVESREETSTDERIGIKRRLYRVTGAGERILAAWEAGGLLEAAEAAT